MIIVIEWLLSGIPLLATIGVVKSILLLKESTRYFATCTKIQYFATCAKDQINILLLKILSRFLVKNQPIKSIHNFETNSIPTNWLCSAVY